MKCRILQSGNCEITQDYKGNNIHGGIDIVNEGYTLGNIVAHTEGQVVEVRNNCKGFESGGSYGNYVKIKHKNGYYTLYAHMGYGTVKVSKGQNVSKGQLLGYMGATGTAFGGHLHFEVRNTSDVRINPTKYLNEDFEQSTISVDTKYKLGNTVTINGVYISSTSKEKLIPATTTGTITKIIPNTNNPYLLNDGQIGWVNDNVIISKENIQFLSNQTYQGVSIVDGLNQIGVDSSFNYRSKLANSNGISNYIGTAEQNTKMLEMLKKGTLKSI